MLEDYLTYIHRVMLVRFGTRVRVSHNTERSFAHINLTNYKDSTTTITATTNATISSCDTSATLLTATTLAFSVSDAFAAVASSGHPDEQRVNHTKNPHIL
jgi:hypothetical protein